MYGEEAHHHQLVPLQQLLGHAVGLFLMLLQC